MSEIFAFRGRDGTALFDCIDCDQRVFSLCHHGPPRCATCRSIPNWHRDPQLRRILGPNLPPFAESKDAGK